jgi:integrase
MMKMRSHHYVPLSTQAVEILRELQPLTGNGRFVFPGGRDRNRAMNNNTVNAALRRLGYSNTQMTGHGFRSMASTLLNEQGWHPERC